MIKVIRKFLSYAGKYKKRFRLAFLFTLLESIFQKMPILLLLLGLSKITNQELVFKDGITIGIGMIISVVLTAVCRRVVDENQSGTGYLMFSDERLKIADYLKVLPMGYFSEENIGKVSAIISSDIVFIEENGTLVLGQVISSYISVLLSVVMLMFFNIYIGLFTLAISLLSVLILNRLQKIGYENSFKKQAVNSKLVGSIIEYVRGMGVIKAFNLSGERMKATRDTFKESRDVMIDYENGFIPPSIGLEAVQALGIAGIIFITGWLSMKDALQLSAVLMMFVFSFEIFTPIKALAAITPQFRVMESALDRYGQLIGADDKLKNGTVTDVDHFGIEFKQVDFAYEEKKVIHDMSFKIEANSFTALVGKSGCGKSTVTNLMMRMWDVQSGVVTIGDCDVKAMSYDKLLECFSVVFQNVYLFNDTVMNNVRIGRTSATDDEVIQACKQSRCHDFIINMPNGYDTMIGEMGNTLSGGEKQRISIARAILKDAPIVLLDEATASIDPDNERYIQEGINKLVYNKTLVVIAHKLKTITSADQILVLDEGKIVEKGTHDALIQAEGMYKKLWDLSTSNES